MHGMNVDMHLLTQYIPMVQVVLPAMPSWDELDIVIHWLITYDCNTKKNIDEIFNKKNTDHRWWSERWLTYPLKTNYGMSVTLHLLKLNSLKYKKLTIKSAWNSVIYPSNDVNHNIFGIFQTPYLYSSFYDEM